MNSFRKTVVTVSRGLSESRRFSRIFSLTYTSQTGERARIDEDESDERRRRDEMTGKGSEDEVKKKAAKERGGKPVDEDKGVDVNSRPIVEEDPSAQSSA